MSAALAGSGLTVVVQNIARHPGTPTDDYLIDCMRKVFGDSNGELTLRLVDETEAAALNERYRGHSGPTNVLAFEAADAPAGAEEPRPLGDLVVCAAVVVREAAEQGKGLAAHFAHMLIHGCLHLRGYDHISAADAAVMEAKERELLAELGIGDPYGDEA